MTRSIAALVVAASILSWSAATAQSPSGPAAVSPGGGIPPASGGAADRTGSIAATGQTKPPGAPVGDRLGTNPDLERKSQAIDQLVEKGICKGC